MLRFLSLSLSRSETVLLSVSRCPLPHLDVLPLSLSLRPPYLCSLLAHFIFSHELTFISRKKELITKIARWVGPRTCIFLALSLTGFPISASCLHLSLSPSLHPQSFLSFTDCFLPFFITLSFCQRVSLFVPLPLHSSKREHSSQSRGDRGLVLKRPLQQERALLEFPAALQPAEMQTAIKPSGQNVPEIDAWWSFRAEVGRKMMEVFCFAVVSNNHVLLHSSSSSSSSANTHCYL